jgi:hypothetical protein
VIPPDFSVFSFDKQKRTPIGTGTISWTFHKLLPALQLTVPSGVAPPHLHCLRHSFAAGRLLRWYRAGVDSHVASIRSFHVLGSREPFLDGRLPNHHHRTAGMCQRALRAFRRE